MPQALIIKQRFSFSCGAVFGGYWGDRFVLRTETSSQEFGGAQLRSIFKHNYSHVPGIMERRRVQGRCGCCLHFNETFNKVCRLPDILVFGVDCDLKPSNFLLHNSDQNSSPEPSRKPQSKPADGMQGNRIKYELSNFMNVHIAVWFYYLLLCNDF